MTTTTTLDIGSLVWQRQRGQQFPPGGLVCAMDDPDHVVVLAPDDGGPFIQIRQRGGRQARGIPTVRAIRIDVDDIEPLTVSPPSLPQMHKVARQALATVAVGKGDFGDLDLELLAYARTLLIELRVPA